MAIKTERYVTEDGRELVRTFSDIGNRIISASGAIYDEAIDPKDKGRTYVETDEPIQSEEATEADKDAALRRFGVEV